MTYDRVALGHSVETFLAHQFNSPARARGGLLFGYHENEVLHILLSSTAGIPNWYAPEIGAVIDVDPRFVLGWSEALLSLFGKRIDWVGNWTIHPDDQLKGARRDVRRFRHAFASGTVTSQNVLIVMGVANGHLQQRAYRPGSDGTPEMVELIRTTQSLSGRIEGRLE